MKIFGNLFNSKKRWMDKILADEFIYSKMKYLIFIFILLFLFLFPPTASPQPVRFTVGWDAVTENNDGTPIEDLSHYTIYLCDRHITDNIECSGNLIDVQIPKEDTHTDIEYQASEGQGSVFIRGSATDTFGNQSVLSNQLEMPFDWNPPKTITIRIIPKQ